MQKLLEINSIRICIRTCRISKYVNTLLKVESISSFEISFTRNFNYYGLFTEHNSVIIRTMFGRTLDSTFVDRVRVRVTRDGNAKESK